MFNIGWQHVFINELNGVKLRMKIFFFPISTQIECQYKILFVNIEQQKKKTISGSVVFSPTRCKQDLSAVSITSLNLTIVSQRYF